MESREANILTALLSGSIILTTSLSQKQVLTRVNTISRPFLGALGNSHRKESFASPKPCQNI